METQFYVTTQGLAAGLANPSVHQTLRGILMGRVHPSTVKAFERRNLIKPDLRKDSRADHNLMVLNGSLERLRSILFTQVQEGDNDAADTANDEARPTQNNGASGEAPAVPLVAPPPASKPQPSRVITRYGLSEQKEPTLSPVMQIIVDAIRQHGTGSIEELRKKSEAVASINPGTLRWAIQQLRQRHILTSHKVQ